MALRRQSVSIAVLLLATRAAGQALTVQTAVGPNAPSLGWFNSVNNAQGPHFMRLSPDGGTLYTVLYDYGSYITPALSSSKHGPQIVAIPVTGQGAVTDGGGSPPWPNVAGGNPTHACNDGVIDGVGTDAQFGRMGICADPGFDNLYVADFDVRTQAQCARFARGCFFSPAATSRAELAPPLARRSTSSAECR